MANVVFILGAGASRQGGAPLMADFLDVAHGLWKSNAVQHKAQHFKMVFDAIGRLQAVHSKAQLDLNNIESVFNTLVMARILGKFPGNPNYAGDAVEEALREVIATTLEHQLHFKVRSRSILPPTPYDEFANLLTHLRREAHPQRSVAVLTFNYDMGADLALYRHAMGPEY